VYTVDGSSEPNNKDAPEDCAVANYTESYDNVFGWADTNCANKFVFMCKLIRGWRRASSAAVPAFSAQVQPCRWSRGRRPLLTLVPHLVPCSRGRADAAAHQHRRRH
jgi:hypothetical protein